MTPKKTETDCQSINHDEAPSMHTPQQDATQTDMTMPSSRKSTTANNHSSRYINSQTFFSLIDASIICTQSKSRGDRQHRHRHRHLAASCPKEERYSLPPL